jgi:hypothetical protein
MSRLSGLSGLDRRVLPVLSSWLRRGRTAAGSATEGLPDRMPDRRRIARIGAIACTALVVAGVLIAVLAGGGGGGSSPQHVTPGTNHTATVGLAPGGDLAAYVAQKRSLLASLPATADVPAMISLLTYVRPTDAATVLHNYRVTRMLYRLSAVSPPQQADIRDLSTDGPRLVPCACMYAAVVQAPADRLRLLARSPYVRLVDPTPAGTTFLTPESTALLPERQS